MTDRTKRSLVTVTLLIAGIFITMLALTTIGMIGKANAQVLDTAVNEDPATMAMQIYKFVRDGSHLPAIGTALMLVVWALRGGVRKLPKIGAWFNKPIGGYVLGFSTATLAFVGPALIAGQVVTFGLITQAIGTGFAASGSWEGFRDMITKVKKSGPASLAAMVMLTLIVLSALPGCGAFKKEANEVRKDLLDCTVGDLASLDGLVPTILPTLGEAPDWKVVSAQLEAAGSRVGTCVFASLVDRWKSNLKLATLEGTTSANQALAAMKAKYSITTVKTSLGVQ